MMGIMWVIWPVISNTMTDTEIVCVTAPDRAAAPTVAYPPANSYSIKQQVKSNLYISNH